MAPVNALTWSAFYARHREDEGAIQSLFEKETREFIDITTGHFEEPNKLAQTIAGSAYANFMLLPAQTGRMHVLHHGFSCNTDEGFSLIFVQGNLSDCSYFKVLPTKEATDQIRSTTEGRRNNTTINCPSLAAMTSTTTADEFAALESQGNIILRKKPNHILIPPSIFLLIDGSSDVRSKDLAIEIINAIRVDPEEDDADEAERKETEAKDLELLFAILWASENNGLTPVTLTDIRGNPTLNQVITSIKSKLRGKEDRQEEGREERMGEAAAWAVSSQSIVQELNRMHEARETEKSLKAATRSLLKSLGPEARDLFTELSTTSMSKKPTMSEFMVSLTTTTTPLKAIGLLRAATRAWEGTFSDGCCHRFLSTGFLSQESNLANPGGFTVFMFHPKTMEVDTKAFDKNTARLREYFDLDVEDDTIAYYAKQGFFHPKNPSDLQTQLQTAHDMLELLTCKKSIATAGLAYILNPKRWKKMITIMHDRFRTQPNFGSKFVYSVDRTLQNFFDQITDCDDVATDGDPHYLVRKATDLMEKVEDGVTLAIALPAVLTATLKTTSATKTTSKNSVTQGSAAASATSPAKKKKKLAHASDEHTNTDVHPTWAVAAGTNYLDLFSSRAPGSHKWPKLVDARLAKKGKTNTAVSMCAKFQMTGKCVQGCTLAHVHASAMSPTEFEQADRIMTEVMPART